MKRRRHQERITRANELARQRQEEAENLQRFREVFPEGRPHFIANDGEHLSCHQVARMSHGEYRQRVLGPA